jgi:hypothetical protein
MNNRQIVASLNDIANTLDNAGLHSEASSITKLMVKLSQSNAPGDKPKSQYRTEPIATTKPKADYVTLMNHVKGLVREMQKPSDQNAARNIELKAIMDKVQSGDYGFSNQEKNAFQRQYARLSAFRDQPGVDDIMAEAFRMYMPDGVTEEGLNRFAPGIEDYANSRGVKNIDRYIQMTKEMLSTRAVRTDRGLTGRHERLRGFGTPYKQ